MQIYNILHFLWNASQQEHTNTRLGYQMEKLPEL